MKSRLTKRNSKRTRRPKLKGEDPGVVEPIVLPDVYTKGDPARQPATVKPARRAPRQVHKAGDGQ